MRSFKLIELLGRATADLNRILVRLKTEDLTPEEAFKLTKGYVSTLNDQLKDEKID